VLGIFTCNTGIGMYEKEMKALSDYYVSLGYEAGRWHIGGEHPHLEECAVRLLAPLQSKRVLEIGYQAGGFAVPVIYALHGDGTFGYTGIDSGEYANSVDGNVIEGFLRKNNIASGKYKFNKGDAHVFLKKLDAGQFDLILVDHYKPLYPREFLTIIKRQLLSPQGYILFHDVLERASKAWVQCRNMCDMFGYSWEMDDNVPGGLAVVRKKSNHTRSQCFLKMAYAQTVILKTGAGMKLADVVAGVKRAIRNRMP